MFPLGASYTVDPTVPLYLLAAFLIAGLGSGVALFERFTEASRRFFLVAFFIALWVAPLGVARGAADVETAQLWLRVAYLWVPLTIPAVYWMTAALAARARRTPPWLIWGVGAAFSALNLAGPGLVDGLRTLFVDGTLAGSGWIGALYVAFELGAIALTVRHMADSRRGALSGAEQREKLLLLAAALVGSLSMLDYLLARDPFRAGLLTPITLLTATSLVTAAALRYRMFAPGQSFATDEVLSAMSDAVLVCDGAGLIRGSNPASHALLGRSEAGLHGRPIGEVVGVTGADGWEAWAPGPESTRNQVMELRPRASARIQVSVSVEPIRFGNRPVGAVVVARDIRNRLWSEQALRQAQLRYRALYHHHPALVHEFGMDGRIVSLNPATRRVLGLGETEPVEHTHWSDYVHPDDIEANARTFDKVMEGASEEYETRLMGPSGPRVVRGVVVPVWDREDIVGIFGVGLDVTEEEEAKRELEVQRRYFAELFESSPEAVVLMDDGDTVVRVNPEFTRLFGFAPEEAVGEELNGLIVPGDLSDEGLDLNRAARTGGVVRTETVRRRKDGSLVEVSVLARNIRMPGGGSQLYGIYRDISDRKLAERELRQREEELRHAQKLEAVGKLAGGIAHDFNNLLTVINGHARLALERAEPDGGLAEDLLEIEKAGTRAGALTQQLLAFSRRQVLRPKVLDPNEVVREVHRMLRRLIGAHIQVETRLTEREVRVRADRGQLEQVLVNLVVNARDAMPEGGTLTLASDVLQLRPGDDRLESWEVEPGEFVRLTVEDTGVGMDARTAERAFEPFFTTKAQGKGTGLGLATVFGIVKQSGGHVAVRSEPGRGTRCDVVLPMARAAVPAPAAPAAEPGPPAPGGTILVVEDETAVRRLAVRVLEREGYAVFAADNGVRALEALGERDTLPDLVLTDLVMPEMGGRELAAHLRERYPRLPILFMSGYDDDLTARSEDGPGFLPKPFTPAALARRVAEMLRAVPA